MTAAARPDGPLARRARRRPAGPARKVDQRLRIDAANESSRPRDAHRPGRAGAGAEAVGPDGPLAERKVFTRADVDPRRRAPRSSVRDPTSSAGPSTSAPAPRVPSRSSGQPGARGRRAPRRLSSPSRPPSRPSPTARRPTTARPPSPACYGRRRHRRARRPRSAAAHRRPADAIGRHRHLRPRHRLVVGVRARARRPRSTSLRAAYEAAGLQGDRDAISGQAARTLHEEAGIDSRTIASLLSGGSTTHATPLDDRTVLIVDEAGMTNDPAMLGSSPPPTSPARRWSWSATTASSAPSAPAAARSARRPPSALPCTSSTRTSANTTPASARALEQLRAGDVTEAVDWYRQHDRIITAAHARTTPSTPRSTRGCRHRSRRATVGAATPGGAPTSPPSTARPASAGPQPATSQRPRNRSARRAPLRRRRPHRHPRPRRGDGRLSSPANAAPSPPSTPTERAGGPHGRRPPPTSSHRDELTADRLDYGYATHRAPHAQGATVDSAHRLRRRRRPRARLRRHEPSPRHHPRPRRRRRPRPGRRRPRRRVDPGAPPEMGHRYRGTCTGHRSASLPSPQGRARRSTSRADRRTGRDYGCGVGALRPNRSARHSAEAHCH